MKKQLLLAFGLTSMLFTSCLPVFYQIYTVEPVGDIVTKEGEIVYDDQNFKVIYDFWSNGGNPGFQFANKSDKNIYINLAESFFIRNGISNNYYKQRVFSKGSSSAISSSLGLQNARAVTGRNNFNLIQTNAISANSSISTLTSSANAVAYNEEKIVCVPPRSSRFIREYLINDSRLISCDLPKAPKFKGDVKTLLYSKEQSPIVFRNRISYTIDKNDSLLFFENEFYLKDIANLPEKKVVVNKKFKDCNGLPFFKPVNTYESKSKFYITYIPNL
jgi:hypothetical protein